MRKFKLILLVSIIITMISCSKEEEGVTPNIIGNSYTGFYEMSVLGYSSIYTGYKFTSDHEVIYFEYYQNMPITPGVSYEKYELKTKSYLTYTIDYPKIVIDDDPDDYAASFGEFLSPEFLRISNENKILVDNGSDLFEFIKENI